MKILYIYDDLEEKTKPCHIFMEQLTISQGIPFERICNVSF